MAELRSAPGMRERSPGVWELIVEAGRDPVTGRRRQVSRTFRGNLRDAKKARAAFLVEASKGRHEGTNASLDDLFADWIVELKRKGRSPNTIAGYEQVYRHNIQPTLGQTRVTKATTQTLTDLYGAHQARGLSARSVYQIHACLSSMFSQACRWGWRDSNPAQSAEPPPIPNTTPVVPTPEEVRALIDAAEESRRPEHARLIMTAATTGLRRAELCGLRRRRDVDLEQRVLRVSVSVASLRDRSLEEIPTKNRRVRTIAIDDGTADALRVQIAMVEDRARFCGVALVDDPYVFTDAADGSEPWKPDAISRFFTDRDVLGRVFREDGNKHLMGLFVGSGPRRLHLVGVEEALGRFVDGGAQRPGDAVSETAQLLGKRLADRLPEIHVRVELIDDERRHRVTDRLVLQELLDCLHPLVGVQDLVMRPGEDRADD